MTPLNKISGGRSEIVRAEEEVFERPRKKARRGTTKPRERNFNDLVDGFRRHNLKLLEQALSETSIGK